MHSAKLRDMSRSAEIGAGMRIEAITVTWMLLEAGVDVGAGILARSVLLTAFGIEAAIELVSGATLLWRLRTEARGGSLERIHRSETRASWITSIALFLLCLYIVTTSVLSIAAGIHPEGSPIGVASAVAALIFMPLIICTKRRVATAIGSAALRADATCSLTCLYMSAALLIGVAVNTLFGFWWADSVGALALLWWLLPEGRAALKAARAGAACS
jgi:divalent metal cation (Fe/Co/Zn/Cd) transporter